MTSIFKSIQRHALLRSIAYILLGIAITLNPNSIYKIIIYIIVAYNIIMGIISLVTRAQNRKKGYDSGIGMTVFYFLSALIIFLFAKPIISFLPILLGIGFVIGGAVRIKQSFNLRQYVNVNWLPMLFYGIFLIAAGIILMIFSFSTVMLFFRAFGILLIISGISELIGFFRFRDYDL